MHSILFYLYFIKTICMNLTMSINLGRSISKSRTCHRKEILPEVDCRKENIIYCVQVMPERSLIKPRRWKLPAGLDNCFLESERETKPTWDAPFNSRGFSEEMCPGWGEGWGTRIALTSAKPWHRDGLTPGERSRGLCRSSSRPRARISPRRTGCWDPERERVSEVNVNDLWQPSPGRFLPPTLQLNSWAYFMLGARRLLGEKRRNVLSAWDEAADFHPSTDCHHRATDPRVSNTCKRRENVCQYTKLQAGKTSCVKGVWQAHFHLIETGCLREPRARVKGTVHGASTQESN